MTVITFPIHADKRRYIDAALRFPEEREEIFSELEKEGIFSQESGMALLKFLLRYFIGAGIITNEGKEVILKAFKEYGWEFPALSARRQFGLLLEVEWAFQKKRKGGSLSFYTTDIIKNNNLCARLSCSVEWVADELEGQESSDITTFLYALLIAQTGLA